ncbi:hypothetical protein CBER1_02495 [Cercospora berteroae]|uniref:F-box domain-containing protein n=1 Tax=Cercospora berteroae TaxID=357750 RepID=A0A2S6C475_9PEZI|nr:hypothetical protein CBER1_02495 [Cercospora berteroae]
MPTLWTAEHQARLTHLKDQRDKVDETIDLLRQQMTIVDDMLETIADATLAAEEEEEEERKALENECAIEDSDEEDSDDVTVICHSSSDGYDDEGEDEEDLTATEAVLYCPPLLARILRHLSAATLFGIQRVNRAFLYTICTSSILRRNLLIDIVPDAETDLKRFADLSHLLESPKFMHAVQPLDFQPFSPTCLGISVKFGAAKKFYRQMRFKYFALARQQEQQLQEISGQQQQQQEEEEYVKICLNWKDMIVPGPMQVIYHRWQPRVPMGFGHTIRDASLGELVEMTMAFLGPNWWMECDLETWVALREVAVWKGLIEKDSWALGKTKGGKPGVVRRRRALSV